MRPPPTATLFPYPTLFRSRAYLRQRANLVRSASRHVQHMQKALEQMNLKLTEVLSDVTGLTGRAVIRAILRGTRAPERSEEHTSELQSRLHLVCRLLLEKK